MTSRPSPQEVPLNLRSISLALTLSLAAAGCGGGGTGSGGTVSAAPTGLAVTLSGTSANLSWTDASTNESGFEVERFTSTGGWAVQFRTGSNATTATSSSLEPGSTYGFRIRSFNGAGKSDFSNEVTVTTAELVQPNRAPVAPYNPNFLSSLTSKNKWGATTITYFVDKGVDTRDAAAINAIVEKAAARWNTGTNGLVTLNRVASAGAANITITFAAANDPDLAGSDEGAATYTFSGATGGRNNLTSSSVKVKAGIPDAQLLPLMAHELGHALGIGGHSDDSADTMHGVVTANTLISARDANTLAKLYLTTD